MPTTFRILMAGVVLCAAAGCGKLATERAVLSAAQADNPMCPDEQMHVVGPVEAGEGVATVYEVRVCDRARYYQDAAPEDGKRAFVQTKRPAGLEGNASLWDRTDGVAPPDDGVGAVHRTEGEPALGPDEGSLGDEGDDLDF